MIDFNNIWPLLLQNGASPRKEEGTRRYWFTLSEDRQQAAITNITRKLAEHAFVHFDPIQAIRENSWLPKAAQPHFLSGTEQDDYWKSSEWLKNRKPLVMVEYEGLCKVCTEQTMCTFDLKFKRYVKPHID